MMTERTAAQRAEDDIAQCRRLAAVWRKVAEQHDREAAYAQNEAAKYERKADALTNGVCADAKEE